MCSASSATTPRRPWSKKNRHEARPRRNGEAHQRDRHHPPPARDGARHRRAHRHHRCPAHPARAGHLSLGRGADYLFTVKGNQPNMLDDIRLTLDEHIAQRAPDFTDESPKPEHGRRERRSIWVSSALNDYLDFPGVGQVFAIGRQTVEVNSAKRHSETVYGVTSLSPQGASPQRLLTLNRGHWTIEATHHILDWSFDEDRRHPHRPRPGGPGCAASPSASSRRAGSPSPRPWPVQKSAPCARLPQDDRQRLPAGRARLSAPAGCLHRPLTLGTRGTTAHARTPQNSARTTTPIAIGPAVKSVAGRAKGPMKARRRVLDAHDSTPTIRTICRGRPPS